MNPMHDYDFEREDHGYCARHRMKISLSDGCPECGDEQAQAEEDEATEELEALRHDNASLHTLVRSLNAQLMALRTDFQQFATHDGACATHAGGHHCDCGLVDVLARCKG